MYKLMTACEPWGVVSLLPNVPVARASAPFVMASRRRWRGNRRSAPAGKPEGIRAWDGARQSVVGQGDPGQSFDRGRSAWTLGSYYGPAPVGVRVHDRASACGEEEGPAPDAGDRLHPCHIVVGVSDHPGEDGRCLGRIDRDSRYPTGAVYLHRIPPPAIAVRIGPVSETPNAASACAIVGQVGAPAATAPVVGTGPVGADEAVVAEGAVAAAGAVVGLAV